ncbi:MAG: YicC family protein [Phyllobacteriaceae bacterium]|nr:YicC family protein [Phyllobacteriaceae bacterium]
MALQSMTGFARTEFALGDGRAVWELKSVNGRALEMRFRLPSGLDRLEPDLRKALQTKFKRGSIFASLTISTRQANGAINLNVAVLKDVLRLRAELSAHIPLAPSTIEGLLAIRGMTGEAVSSEPSADDDALLIAGFDNALAELAIARAREGATLAAVITGQMAEVERLAGMAAADPSLTVEALMRRLQGQLALLTHAGTELDPQRLHGEAALLATKLDIAEEIARLRIHAAEVRGLVACAEAAGRKLDFLAQELNREANTLCSKANAASLTAIGLDLKVLIDQFREQTQNLE